MKVVLADDHALVRHGLRLTLERIVPGVRVREADDGREAVRAVREDEPELCLLDLNMPGLGGMDAIPAILADSPRTRILVVSMHGARALVQAALRAGARGYLLKDAAVEELSDAVKALREGRPYLSRRLADEMLVDYVRTGQGLDAGASGVAAVDTRSTPDLLTPRQREVLLAIAEGRSTRETAVRLNLSVKTVETHRAELMRRLDIWDVAGLTRYAVRHGLVEP